VLFRPFLVLATVAVAFVAGRAVGYQAHMQNALAALQNAHEELQQSQRDKGGHRTNAVGLVEQAIYQVQTGIQVAAEHGG
jgi:hypothetical protein